MVDNSSKKGMAEILIAFNGVMLRFDGAPSADGTWNSARLVSISVYDADSPAATFDGRLFVGMNISELLLVYPMIDETGFVYTFETAEGTYKLEFEFDDNKNVSKIRLGEVTQRPNDLYPMHLAFRAEISSSDIPLNLKKFAMSPFHFYRHNRGRSSC